MICHTEIYRYSDFRLFLRDYYLTQKRLCKGFTLATIAQRAGFAAPSFIKHVFDGKRNLTEESCNRISRALRLSKSATAYFLAMVKFCQSDSIEEKMHSLKEMDRFRPRGIPHVLSSSDYRYLEHWYNPAICELVELPGFVESSDWIAQALIGSIKPDNAQKALDFLLKAGFLVRTEQGRLAKKEQTVTAEITGTENIMAAAMRTYHLSMMQIAQKAVSDLPVDKRAVSSTTLSLSPTGYAAALERIIQFRHELLEIAKSDRAANRVYQLSLTLFPLSKDLSTVALRVPEKKQ